MYIPSNPRFIKHFVDMVGRTSFLSASLAKLWILNSSESSSSSLDPYISSFLSEVDFGGAYVSSSGINYSAFIMMDLEVSALKNFYLFAFGSF